jgi:hypothetical protein
MLGLHHWVFAKQRSDDQEGFVVCRDCGRRRGGGTRISLVLFAAFFVGAILVFWLWSPLLGAVMMVGAVGGLLWSAIPIVIDRITRWLSLGR